jgi:hypothetical protein
MMHIDWRRYLRQISLQEERRIRVVEAVAAHFGREKVNSALRELSSSPLSEWSGEGELRSLHLGRQSLQKLARTQTEIEATTYRLLCEKTSKFPAHVEEQILFGARTFGQQIGRSELMEVGFNAEVSAPLAVKIVFDCIYTGLEEEKNVFLCLRSMGGSTVHIRRSEFEYLEPTLRRVLSLVRNETIKGILEIIAPDISLEISTSMESGDSFGLMQFRLKSFNASATQP